MDKMFNKTQQDEPKEFKSAPTARTFYTIRAPPQHSWSTALFTALHRAAHYRADRWGVSGVYNACVWNIMALGEHWAFLVWILGHLKNIYSELNIEKDTSRKYAFLKMFIYTWFYRHSSLWINRRKKQLINTNGVFHEECHYLFGF